MNNLRHQNYKNKQTEMEHLKIYMNKTKLLR